MRIAGKRIHRPGLIDFIDVIRQGVLDKASLNEVGKIGAGGRYPGLFYGVGSVAVDSRGNLYTGETYEGKRVQKFVKK